MIKKIGIYLCLFLLTMLMVNRLTCIELNYSTDENGIIQVFYEDINKGFSEANSFKKDVHSANRGKVRVNIPKKQLNQIRIDFDGISNINISSIELKLLGILIMEYNVVDIINEFNFNDLEFTSMGSNLQLEVTGNDPYISINRFVNGNTGIVILSITFILSFIIYLGFIYIGVKYKLKDNIGLILKNKLIIYILLGSLFYILYPIIITFDTGHYFNYVNIMNMKLPLEYWDPVRSFGFPLYIYMGEKILGKSYQGMFLWMYIQYILMILYTYKISKLFIKSDKINCVLMFLVILNPIILGYYHVLLTEPLATTLMLIYIYYIYTYYTKIRQGLGNDKKIISNYIILSSILVLLWNIKQTYVLLALIPLLVISLFKYKELGYKNIIKLILCNGIVFIISITLWGNFLENKVITYDNSRTNSSLLSKQIIEGLSYFDYDVTNKNKTSETWKIRTKDSEKTTEVIMSNQNSVLKSIEYFINCIKHSPIDVVKSYIRNYLVIINAYEVIKDTPLLSEIEVDETFKLGKSRENDIIGYRCFKVNNSMSNVFDMTPELYNNIRHLSMNVELGIIGKLMYYIVPLYNIIFTLSGLIVIPITLIGIFNKYFRTKYFILTISSILHFSNIIALSILGAIIDRYIFTSYAFFMIAIAITYLKVRNEKLIGGKSDIVETYNYTSI